MTKTNVKATAAQIQAMARNGLFLRGVFDRRTSLPYPTTRFEFITQVTRPPAGAIQAYDYVRVVYTDRGLTVGRRHTPITEAQVQLISFPHTSSEEYNAFGELLNVWSDQIPDWTDHQLSVVCVQTDQGSVWVGDHHPELLQHLAQVESRLRTEAVRPQCTHSAYGYVFAEVVRQLGGVIADRNHLIKLHWNIMGLERPQPFVQ